MLFCHSDWFNSAVTVQCSDWCSAGDVDATLASSPIEEFWCLGEVMRPVPIRPALLRAVHGIETVSHNLLDVVLPMLREQHEAVPSDAGWAYVDPKERALKAILRDKVEDRIIPHFL